MEKKEKCMPIIIVIKTNGTGQHRKRRKMKLLIHFQKMSRSLRIAVEQMHLSLTKAKELILETARQLDEQHVEEQAKICKKIKEILKDKIQEGKISEGWIEECLPGEYKRRYTRPIKSTFP